MNLDDIHISVSDNAPFGIALHEIIYNSDGLAEDFCFLHVNKSFIELTGLVSPDLVGRTVSESFSSSDQDTLNWPEIYGKVIQEGTQLDFEVFSLKSNRWYRVFIYSPSEARLITVFIDITDGKQALLNADDRLLKLSRAVEQSPASVVITNLLGEIEYVNPKFTAVTGYTFDEAIGQNPRILKSGSQPDEIYRDMWTKISSGQEWQGEFHNKMKDGTLYWESASISPIIGENGKISHFLAVKEDITRRKEAEAEILAKNAALSELNATRDRFFSIIAHDLRSPFSGIIGFSELLVEQIREKDYEGIELCATSILKSSRRMMDLLTNLLEWARSQTGRLNFCPEWFDLVNFVGEIIPIFQQNAMQKSLSIRTNLPKTLPVVADKHMISTVIRNLISNAMKFSNPDGEIFISAEENESEIVLSVKDNGVGIDNERIKTLFHPDTNRATPGTAKEMGTGLGLVLCKEFVEKHGGKIWVDSPEGEGAIFSFTLPLIR